MRGQFIKKMEYQKIAERIAWIRKERRLTSWNTKISCWFNSNGKPSRYKNLLKKFTQKLLSKVSFLIQCTLLSIAMLPPVESFFNSTSRPDPIILVMLRHHGFHCELIMRFSYLKHQPATPDWRTLLKFVCLQLQFQYYQKLITRGKRDQLEIGTESTSEIFFFIFKL